MGYGIDQFQLSKYWKQRMTTLPLIRGASLRLSKKTRLAILALACLMFAVPTIYLSRAPAAPTEGNSSSKLDPVNANESKVTLKKVSGLVLNAEQDNR